LWLDKLNLTDAQKTKVEQLKKEYGKKRETSGGQEEGTPAQKVRSQEDRTAGEEV